MEIDYNSIGRAIASDVEKSNLSFDEFDELDMFTSTDDFAVWYRIKVYYDDDNSVTSVLINVKKAEHCTEDDSVDVTSDIVEKVLEEEITYYL